MSFNYSPKIITDGLVFYTDPFNFKSRNRSEGLSGGTIVDLTSSSYVLRVLSQTNQKFLTIINT